MERHEVLTDTFELIYLDTSTKLLVGVKPYADLVPLFRQTDD